MTRPLLTIVLSVILLGAMTVPAFGGGAVWHFEGYHRPGDIVVSTTAVAWDHDTSLGRPEDGPFLIYLHPADPTSEEWPVADEGLLVGIVEVHLGPLTERDGDSFGPNHAIARFEIPDVPAGSYQILHCDDPCTTTLGDIVGGWDLRVIGGSDGRPADEIAAEVRERLPTAPLVIPSQSSRAETDNEAASAFPATVEPPILTAQVAAVAAGERDVPDRESKGPLAADEYDPVPVKEPRSGSTESPGPTDEEPVRFDALWLWIVALFSLLLIVGIVRTELRWVGPTRSRARPRNESRSRGVLTDE